MRHLTAVSRGWGSCIAVLVLCASVVSHVAFILFLITPSFDIPGGLCVVIVTFPGYLYLYILVLSY